MFDLFRTLFRCVGKQGVNMLFGLGCTQMILAILTAMWCIFYKNIVHDPVPVFIWAMAFFAYTLVLKLQLEDTKKLDVYFMKPTPKESDTVWRFFSRIDRADGGTYTVYRVAIFIVLGIFFLVGARLTLFQIMRGPDPAGLLISVDYMVASVVGIVFEMFTTIGWKDKLELIETGQFEYAEVTLVEKYRSIAYAGVRNTNALDMHFYFAIVQDQYGNKGRIKLHITQYEMLADTMKLYLIKLNDSNGFWNEMDIYADLSNGYLLKGALEDIVPNRYTAVDVRDRNRKKTSGE